MMEQRLYIGNDKDREAVAVVLYRNGYTVWEEKEKQGNKNKKILCYKKGVTNGSN